MPKQSFNKKYKFVILGVFNLALVDRLGGEINFDL